MMSAFSRGFLLKPRCLFPAPKSFAFQFMPTSRSPLPRSFTTSQLFRHAIPKARQVPPKESPKGIPKRPSKGVNGAIKKSLPASPTYQSFADSLASKSHSTLLYTAPSHTMFVTASYSAAIFCLSYAGYAFNIHYLYPPPDIQPWVPVGFGVIAFAMACFGGYMALNPARLIRAITAIPRSQAQALKKGVGVAKNGPLMLEIELRKMFPVPFFPARKIFVRPEDLTLSHRIYAPPVDARQSAVGRVEQRKRLEREHAAERRKSIWWRPFRDASRLFYRFFKAMRLVWTRESFLKLGIKGTNYKLDVSDGWALDEGRALDRLIQLKAPS